MTEDKKTQDTELEEESVDDLDELEEDVVVEEDEEPNVEALQQELNEAREKMMRVAADADNFKKRMEREKTKLLKYAGENILRELLATVDNLDRALEQGGVEGGDPQQKLEALLAGVDLTRKGLDSMLERFDVTPLEAVGQPFDPDEMDALTMEASEEIPANHVLKEFAKGFMFKDRILRHAQVVVSSGPVKEE